MTKRVYPVDGRYLNGVPHVEHDCDDPFCVESGAFTTDPPPKPKKAKSPPDGEPDAEES
jgi:hypothetical protein